MKYLPMQFQNRGYTYAESCESTMYLLPDIVRQRAAQNVLKVHDFRKIQKSKVDLHTTFTRAPTEKLITSEYACLEAIQLFFETFFDIINGVENISI